MPHTFDSVEGRLAHALIYEANGTHTLVAQEDIRVVLQGCDAKTVVLVQIVQHFGDYIRAVEAGTN